MHSTTINEPDGRSITIIHNGDWSGDVSVRVFKKNIAGTEHWERTCTIPGDVLLAIVRYLPGFATLPEDQSIRTEVRKAMRDVVKEIVAKLAED